MRYTQRERNAERQGDGERMKRTDIRKNDEGRKHGKKYVGSYY